MAGATVPRLARALAARSEAAARSGIFTAEERVLTALRRHSAGRSPGVTPESLVTLTGLPQHVLGGAVSSLVQAGELVRDAWLVRLPSPDDLLPGTSPSRPSGPANPVRWRSGGPSAIGARSESAACMIAGRRRRNSDDGDVSIAVRRVGRRAGSSRLGAGRLRRDPGAGRTTCCRCPAGTAGSASCSTGRWGFPSGRTSPSWTSFPSSGWSRDPSRRVVKDDAQRVAAARSHTADTVANVDAIEPRVPFTGRCRTGKMTPSPSRSGTTSLAIASAAAAR